MPGDRWSRFKSDLVFIGAFALLGALLVRLFDLQVLDHAAYAAVRDAQSRAVVDARVPRGSIRDAQGEILAISVPAASIASDPTLLADRGAAVRPLAQALGMDPVEIAAKLNRKNPDGRDARFAWLKRFATPEQAAAVKALKLPGVTVITEFDRRYPRETAFAHLLGVVDIDERGGEGVERSFDSVLAPRGRAETVEVDGRRRRLDFPASPDEGVDVVLTVDGRFQQVVEEELDAACGKYRPKWACVVALDPGTGALLALACRPTFDPNRPGAAPADARRNRALTDPFEPGSTFKPFIVAGAIEQGLVTAGSRFDCEMGEWRCGSRLLHDHHPHGVLTVTDIVAKSSNIGAVKIGMKLGAAGAYRSLRAFGFGSKTGIDLPAEGVGIVHPLKRWNSYSISSIPMGHEVAVTPLQLASAMGAIANGGLLMKPRVVKRTASGADIAPVELGRVVSPATAATMRAILAEVMKTGTGKDVKVEGLALAGKTGTTQKLDRRGVRYGYIASFAGFAPVEDARVVLAVVIDEPQGAYYGGAVAAPVFEAILRRGWPLLKD